MSLDVDNYIEFDKNKLKNKKSIIYDEKSWNITTITSSKKNDIKNNIYDLLSATNLDYNFFDNHKKCIISWELVKYILSTVPKDIDHHDKLEIIKNTIKDILKLPTYIAIFIWRWKIVIIDTWKKIQVYTWDRKGETNKVRFNWYNEEVLKDIVEDLFWISYSWKKIIRDLLDNIDISSYTEKNLADFLENWYKWYLLNRLAEKIIDQYDSEKDVAIAVAWYLLRLNFLEAKSIILEKYTELLITYIENNDLVDNTINFIITNFFNLSSINFENNINEYLLYLNNIIKIWVSKKIEDIINEHLKKENIFDNKSLSNISNILLENYFDIKEFRLNLINNIIDSIFDDIIWNKWNLSKNAKLFFTFLHNKGITINLPKSDIEYDVIEIIQKIRNILFKIIKLESSIEKLKDNITKFEKKVVNKYFIEEQENLLRENKDFIEDNLSKLDMNHGINSIFELKKKYENEINEINKLLENIKFKSLQWNKINKLIKTKKELLDKIKLIWDIKTKYEENNKLYTEINKYKTDIRLFTSNNIKLKEEIKELKILKEDLSSIKKSFAKSILKYNK